MKKGKKRSNNQRKWLPTFAELIDRLTIHQLKEVFIPEHKDKYRREIALILEDLDTLIKEQDIEISSELIRAIIVLAQFNEHIWYNEARVRQGDPQDLELLRLTHGLNGIRTRSMNRILQMIGDDSRQDYKTDCLAAEHSNWDIEFDNGK